MAKLHSVHLGPIALGKVTGLSLATGGLYSLLWYHRTVATVRQHLPTPRSAIRRTVAFAFFHLGVIELVFFFRAVVYTSGWRATVGVLREMPVLAAAQVLSLLAVLMGARELIRFLDHDFEDFRHEAGGTVLFQRPAVYGYLFCLLFALWILPNPFRLLALAAAYPLRKLQLAMNNYLDGLNVREEEESRLRPLELVFATVLGLTMLWIIGGAMIQFIDTLNPTSAPGM